VNALIAPLSLARFHLARPRSRHALRAGRALAASTAVLTLVIASPARAQGTSGLPPPPPPPPGEGAPPADPPSVQPSGGGGGRSREPARRGEDRGRRRRERDRDREDDRARDVEEVYAVTDAPPARTGFQLALRTGVSVPLGEVAGNQKMSDTFGVHLPLLVDVGGKVIPQLFVGGYLGVSFGGAGGATGRDCDRDNDSCGALGFRFGAQVQYHILPDRKVNPWVGYGIGYEIQQLSRTRRGNDVTTSLGGFEFAHFLFGVDFRLSRVFGIGPFLDISLGQYGTQSSTTNNVTSSGPIGSTSVHEWFTLGVRGVFFP